MPTKDPEKNREYVAKHRAMKKQTEEGKKQYNALNLSYIVKHNNKKIEEEGKEKFKEDKRNYMKEYRKKKKEQENKNKASIVIQNAFRNKKAIDTFATKKAIQIIKKENDDRNKKLLQLQNAFRNKLARKEFSKLKEQKENDIVGFVLRDLQQQQQQEQQIELSRTLRPRGRPRKNPI